MDVDAAVSGAVGGAIIGLAASCLLLGIGRVAGISGITATALTHVDRAWRLAFVAGLLLVGFLAADGWPDLFVNRTGIGGTELVIGGLLVGFGTRLGSGCTSGHGVCGLSRASKRSLVATVTFMLMAGVTVFITQHLLGGGS
jgi:uncharacterized protein